MLLLVLRRGLAASARTELLLFALRRGAAARPPLLPSPLADADADEFPGPKPTSTKPTSTKPTSLSFLKLLPSRCSGELHPRLPRLSLRSPCGARGSRFPGAGLSPTRMASRLPSPGAWLGLGLGLGSGLRLGLGLGLG